MATMSLPEGGPVLEDPVRAARRAQQAALCSSTPPGLPGCLARDDHFCNGLQHGRPAGWRGNPPEQQDQSLAGGGAVEPRTTSSPEISTVSGLRAGSATKAISSSAARVPTSYWGIRIVVNGGYSPPGSSMSVKPPTQVCPGEVPAPFAAA